jgi:hypothetical protein
MSSTQIIALYYKTWLNVSTHYMIIPRHHVYIETKLKFENFILFHNEISGCLLYNAYNK